MKFHTGDKLILAGIECRVALISPKGNAYLTPDLDDEVYGNEKTLRGVVFAIVNSEGKDKFGNKVVSITNSECQAV
jgi:hypothetical protein